jgi:hypothetical protein
MTPSEFRGDYLLYKRDRFIMTEDRILSAIQAEGQVPSSRSLADFYKTGTVNGCKAPPPVKDKIEAQAAG